MKSLLPVIPQWPLSLIAMVAALALSACGGGDATDTATTSDQAMTSGMAQAMHVSTSATTRTQVTITSPTNGSQVSSNSVSVSGSAKSLYNIVKVSYTLNNGVTGSANLMGTGRSISWAIPAIILVPGTNTITVTAVDKQGTTSSASVSVTQSSGSTSSGLITDQRMLTIPNPGVYPAKGQVTADPATGFNVVRVADKSELTGDYGGHQSTQSEIVYSRYTPSNTTGEFVLVHGDNSTSAWVYRVSDNALMTILRFNPSQGSASRALGEVNELRWDYSGKFPYRLYFVGNSISGTAQAGENIGMSLYYTDINPTSGQQSTPVLVHDFSKEFPAFAKGSIMNDVEGDSSIDSRYWAWQIMDTTIKSGTYLPLAIFTYDKQTDTVTAALQRSCTGSLVPCVVASTPATAAPYLSRPNMVEMSPLGTRVVVDWGRVYSGNRDADLNTVADGPKAFLPNFSDPIRIGADETHSGWAWGLNGEELFVSQNDRNDWIEAVNIASAATANCQLISDNSYTCGTKIAPYSLLDGGTWTMGMHFGKFYDPTKRGLAYVSTYDNSSANWGHNQNVFIAINDYTTKPSTVFRLGSSYNLHYDYRSEGSGALDFAANNIWVTANWGFTDGRGDVFRVQLPTSWYAGTR